MFSTTSADYLATQRNYFSTTSANYFIANTNAFSTTSAIYFANASSTIPKTYTNNIFTGTNTFTFATTTYLGLGGVVNALLSTDANGTVVGTTTITTNYLTNIDKGFFFSTTSANYFTSVGLSWSTTSADAWKNVNNFFSTTSASATGRSWSGAVTPKGAPVSRLRSMLVPVNVITGCSASGGAEVAMPGDDDGPRPADAAPQSAGAPSADYAGPQQIAA